MYYKLNDREIEKVIRVLKMENTDYELIGNLIPVESLVAMIEDLLLTYDGLEKEYNDFKQEVEDNYKPISYKEQTGYNERDFY